MDAQHKKVILLIEDDKALNRAANFKLEQKGYRVFPVFAAEEAFLILGDHYKEIDIIWLDILLPGMNGLDFLKALREHRNYDRLKVVICSVSGRTNDKEELYNLNVSDYLVKSDYSIEGLVEKISSFV